jgi:hypothetical protein
MMSFMLAWCGQFVLYPEFLPDEDLLAAGRFRFNRVFADNSPAVGLSPLLPLEKFADFIGELMPWTNHIIELNIHAVHDETVDTNGYQEGWEVIGPILTRKLDFLATFINDIGAVVFPEDIEPILNEEEARIRGMMPPT